MRPDVLHSQAADVGARLILTGSQAIYYELCHNKMPFLQALMRICIRSALLWSYTDPAVGIGYGSTTMRRTVENSPTPLKCWCKWLL
jgi:hypothetical protein